MKKRMLSLLLVLILTCSLLPASALALETIPTSGQCGEGAYWEFDESTNTLTISGEGKMEDYVWVDPPWEAHKAKMETFVAKEGVTSIGANALSDCGALTAVSLPNSLEEISQQAFLNCVSLECVVLPEGLTGIGQSAFQGCESLISVDFPGSLVGIGSLAFYGCVSLPEVTIYSNVQSIGQDAFARCYGLKSFVIPNSVSYMGWGVFSECLNLESVVISRNVTEIYGMTFYECDALRTVYYAGSEEQWKEIKIGEDNECLERLSPIYNYSPSEEDQENCAHKVSGPTGDGYHPLCDKPGLTEGVECYDCGKVLEEPVAIPPWGHTETTTQPAVSATCTTDGMTEEKYCITCREVTKKQEIVPATGHTEIVMEAVQVSCVENGFTEGRQCSVCGVTIVAQQEILAVGHKYDGSKCTVCGEENPDYVEPTPTPTPTPAPAPSENPFTDVADTAWYAVPVLWAVSENVTGGISADRFGPHNSCTRAQVVTFLWAANGKPEPSSMDNPFVDVADDAWYLKPVLWAVENGITGGTSATTFGPENTCTRAQIVTFLYAAAGKPEVSGESTFGDVANDAWYVKPVLWAAKNDVTGGIGGGKFGPDNTCTRAQVVTFLYKVYG